MGSGWPHPCIADGGCAPGGGLAVGGTDKPPVEMVQKIGTGSDTYAHTKSNVMYMY